MIIDMKSKANSIRLKLLIGKFVIVMVILAFIYLMGVLVHKVLIMDGLLSFL